jgi:hypothetical protein
MIGRAHDRYLSATLTLARVRRLLRPEVQQINVATAGAQQLNVAGLEAPKVPEVPSR